MGAISSMQQEERYRPADALGVALAEIARLALAGLDSKELIARCTKIAAAALGCTHAEVWQAGPDGLRNQDGYSIVSRSEAAAADSLLREGQANDVYATTWLVPPAGEVADELCSGAVSLLTLADGPPGVLSVGSTDCLTFSDEQLGLLQATAAILAMAIQRDEHQATLRTGQGRLRDMVNISPMLIWIADQSGKLAFFNERLLSFTGHTLEEQVAEGWRGTVHPDDIDLLTKRFQAAVDGQEQLEAEVRLRSASGGYRWFLNRAVPVPGPDGEFGGFIGSSVDITEQRHAMEAMHALVDLGTELASSLDQQDILRVLARFTIARGLGDAALLALGGHDGRFHSAIGHHGDSARAYLVNALSETVEDGAEDGLLRQVARLRQPAILGGIGTGLPNSLNPRQLELLGEMGATQVVGVPLLARGRVVGALALLREGGSATADDAEMELANELARRTALAVDNASLYAEEQRSRRELQRANEALQFLADAGVELSQLLHDGQAMQRVAVLAVPTFADVAVIDVFEADGRLKRLGTAASSERLERLVHEFQPQSAFGHGSAGRTLLSGNPVMIAQVRKRHLRLFERYFGDASIVREVAPRSALFVPMTARGEVLGLLTFVRTGERTPFTPADLAGVAEQLGRRAGLSVDNTRLFAESQEREVALQEANVAKDEFLGLMSHELRTPITVINGGAQVLAARGNTIPEDLREGMMADITRESARLASMLEDLLALARIELGQPPVVEPVLLHRLIERLADGVNRPTRRELRLTIEPNLPPVAAEPAYVDHLLRNLISNAEKYSPEEHPIEVQVDAGANAVIVRVLDHGPGVPPEELDRIFERFYRSGRTVKLASGAGMGLAVCKRLIETMSGEIWARPREGGGLEVGFSLPFYDEEDE